MIDFSDNTKLAEQKRQLLELLLAQEGIELDQTPRILPRTNSEKIPLSFAQQRLWFFEQLQPGSSFYNIPAAVRLRGYLHVEALEKSLNEIVRRHEILRTTFVKLNEEPVQVIKPHSNFSLPIINLSHLPKAEQEIQVVKLAQAAAEYPFDLAKDSLLHIQLLQLDEQEHLLLIVMHHIITDGWSLGVFVRELTLLYKAFANGCPSPLPELPIQYADFAIWQRQHLQGEVLETQLSYWKQQLQGLPPLLQLPSDRPRSPVQSFRGAMYPFALSKTVTEALKDLSQRENVTLFMTLLAAFKTLLHRYTKENDISIGSPVANRNQVETEHLMGMFVNTLVMRTDLAGNPSFRELLSRVRKIATDAFSHQDIPFEKLVEELQPERNLSYTPLFQVAFALQNTATPTLEFAGIELNIVQIENHTAKFDLSLDLTETDESICGYFEYNTDLFEAEAIARMGEHFQTLLAGIIANPEQRLGELPILPEKEQHQLLVEFNQTQSANFPDDENCLHQLIAAQVARTPDAVAVEFAGKQLTYRELNAKANQLAHYLQKLGVKPDVLVGICVERSLEMAVGILGILKAGGAYLPLDPAYPQERLAWMLTDSQTPLILTQQHILESIPPNNAQVILLDAEWETIAQNSQENPVNQVTGENLAYIIYTSGSTGKPKGVMIPHRGVVNHGMAMAEEFCLNSNDRVLQFASISFDIAVEELFPSWFSGATVVLRTEKMLSSIANFLQGIEQQQVSIVNLPTAFWHEWVYEMSLKGYKLPACLRMVIVGGEKASATTYAAWLQIAGEHIRWLNCYGPTETTVTATVYEPAKSHAHQTAIADLPIGRPIANTQIYLLDSQLLPVPIGVAGEIHIGGAGLARGYLHRPDLTSLKFIPHPYSNGYLYKTGDLARYLPDGNIQFLGRIDYQVKIRGFRIELGEIEALLSQHPHVAESVVLVQPDKFGDQRLVAYLVTKPDFHLAELRNFLKEKLPSYMIPSAFVQLEKIPLTSNGKLDRQSLPKAEDLLPETRVAYVAPRTELEQAIANIWQEVLQVEKVGLHDNFFDLGGHSLLVIRIHDRLQEIIQQDISIMEIFKYPTVSSLAQALSPATKKNSSVCIKTNNQFDDIKEGRNRLKQRLLRSSHQ